MSRSKVVALRDFTIFEPAEPPATKETRREFRAGEEIEATPEQAALWLERGLAAPREPGEAPINEELPEE